MAVNNSKHKPDSSHDKAKPTPEEELHRKHFRMMGELAGTALVKDYEAKHDALTGLLNKSEFKSQLEKRKKSAETQRSSNSFGIFFADLTNFKKANDDPEVGHERVDRLLRDFGAVLEGTLRTDQATDEQGDQIAHERLYESTQENQAGRYGGDELVGLIDLNPRKTDESMTSEQRLMRVAERVRESFHKFIAEQEPAIQDVGLDIAIGIAVWEPGVGTSQLLETADKDMQRVKEEQHAILGKYRST